MFNHSRSSSERREPYSRTSSGGGSGGRKPAGGKRSSRPAGTGRFPSQRMRFQLPKDAKIDYKEVALLQRFVSDRGKILSRRHSGISAKEQRDIVKAIKRARFLGLLTILGVKKKS